MNKKILVLGHNGMLGNAVCKYLENIESLIVLKASKRFGDENYEEYIKDISPDFIINCIGAIPQRKPSNEEYIKLNTELPIFLDSLGFKVIQPSTDCEFKGDIAENIRHEDSDEMDADDIYGISKANATKFILNNGKNTKIIRTSIIGHENESNISLLDWFLSQKENVKGYTNHLWNGITTLEWAKQAYDLILNWDNYKILTQIGTKEVNSKFDILVIAKDVYNKNIEILPFKTEITLNKALKPDIIAKSLKDQLIDLKEFYNK